MLKTAISLLISLPLLAGTDVLIVCDEIPAMQVLASQLKERIHIASTITSQTELPSNLSSYPAVIVYIHRSLNETAEKAFIDYAQAGGKLILLHHSISSGKRINHDWFPFLRVSLPTTDFAEGGFKYFDPANSQVVNLAAKEYITTHNVTYPEKFSFDWNGGDKEYPGFSMLDTEVYLNHVLSGPRTILLGIKFQEPKSGKVFMQADAGWYMPAEKGMVMYFMPGHKASDFDNPAYAQILANAVQVITNGK